MSGTTPPWAIGYVRTAARDEDNLQRQIAAIRDYCEDRGIVVAKIVTARGQSGMRPFDSRGGLIVKEAIENDAIDMLIATDTSRLSRDTKDLTNVVHWMSHHDVRIFVVDQDASRVPETCPLTHNCEKRRRHDRGELACR